MLYEDNTAKLLGLEDVIIKKVREDESAHHIELELPRRKHSCPCYIDNRKGQLPSRIKGKSYVRFRCCGLGRG